VQFLLAHIESFVDDDDKELRERARQFVPAGGLDKIERLVDVDPSDARLPLLCLERLSAFFDCGLLLQRGLNSEEGNWWVTDLFWRGQVFHLDLKDQVRANGLVPEITPLQVHRASAPKVLNAVNMRFLLTAADADAFLLRPAPSTSYVLFSNLGSPFTLDHIASAHRLVNKSFLY
jgi:hypothetical protein